MRSDGQQWIIIHKLILALKETPESVSLCLTATALVALNWRL